MTYEFKGKPINNPSRIEYIPEENDIKGNPMYHPGTKIPITEPYNEIETPKTEHYEFPKNYHPGTGIPLGEGYNEPIHRRR